MSDIRTRSEELPEDGNIISRATPLPWGKLSVLMAVRLAEPIGMTLILPFMYQMVGDFDIVHDPKDISFYASLLLTSFTIFKTATSIHWGILSDRIGRRPVILLGLLGNLLTFVLFGVSKSFTWALIARSLNGLFTGNTIAIKSVIAEISDNSNRSQMMAMLPLMWNLGTMLGGAVGGLFVNPVDKYPSLFGDSVLFREYPYLLPCLVASAASLFGLLVGYFQLEETLVIRPSATPISGVDSETTPLVSESSSEEGRCQTAAIPQTRTRWDILTPTVIRILVTNAIVCVVVAMHNQLYPIVAATDVSDGGLGMDPQKIGYTLTLCGVFVVFMQMTQYAKLERKHGALACYQRGLWLLAVFSTTFPFLSILADRMGSSVKHIVGFDVANMPSPAFCAFWGFLVIELYIRMLGDTLAFTSVNLLVVNIAPTKTDLGFVNGLQQQIAMSAYIVGTLVSGYLWSWSIKHSLPYPLNSHFVWVLGGISLAISWYIACSITDSVNVFASDTSEQSRTVSEDASIGIDSE